MSLLTIEGLPLFFEPIPALVFGPWEMTKSNASLCIQSSTACVKSAGNTGMGSSLIWGGILGPCHNRVAFFGDRKGEPSFTEQTIYALPEAHTKSPHCSGVGSPTLGPPGHRRSAFVRVDVIAAFLLSPSRWVRRSAQ